MNHLWWWLTEILWSFFGRRAHARRVEVTEDVWDGDDGAAAWHLASTWAAMA